VLIADESRLLSGSDPGDTSALPSPISPGKEGASATQRDTKAVTLRRSEDDAAAAAEPGRIRGEDEIALPERHRFIQYGQIFTRRGAPQPKHAERSLLARVRRNPHRSRTPPRPLNGGTGHALAGCLERNGFSGEWARHIDREGCAACRTDSVPRSLLLIPIEPTVEEDPVAVCKTELVASPSRSHAHGETNEELAPTERIRVFGIRPHRDSYAYIDPLSIGRCATRRA
jgi:hypothetical protein